MSCTTRSRLTNVTRPPVATVASYGIIPNGVIVTVAASGGAAGAGSGTGAGTGVGEGADGPTVDADGLAGVDPHAAAVNASARTHARRTQVFRLVTLVCRNSAQIRRAGTRAGSIANSVTAGYAAIFRWLTTRRTPLVSRAIVIAFCDSALLFTVPVRVTT